MSSVELSPRQTEILEYIRAQVFEHGFPPSVREIARHFGIRSPNGVMCHLKALEMKGLIARKNGHARCLTLVGKRPARLPMLPFAGPIS